MAKKIFCGSCGQKVSKKKNYCDDCDISVDEFKEPYHKVPKLYLIFLIALFLMTIWMYILIFVYNVNITIYFLSIHLILHIVAIILTIRAIQAKRKGYLVCNKCKNDISYKAKYCINCGNKVLYGINM